MPFQKAIFISFGVGTVLALGGCGAKDTQPMGGGGVGGLMLGSGGVVVGSGGTPAVGGMPAGGAPAGGMTAGGGMTGGAGMAATGGPGTTCATTNLAGYTPNAAPISFTTDILPMFGLSCVTSDCHNSADSQPRAGLQLGHKCGYDVNAKWKCTFPATPMDPNDLASQPAPNDAATVMAIYQDLMMPSKTAPAMARVKPGDPSNSFLMLKLANLQNSKMLTCMNQDPSHEMNPGPCGVNMPQGSDPWCDGSSRPKLDAIGQWIANGAPMN